ncbi:unnamed protein product, partial [Phaeothamnion confervicola]
MWQLCDSALPTGGFAHSNGLEAAAAEGEVSTGDVQGLARFVQRSVASIASLQLPLLLAAHAAAMSNRGIDDCVEVWAAVDRLTDASITNQVARRASVAQGNALLRIFSDVF